MVADRAGNSLRKARRRSSRVPGWLSNPGLILRRGLARLPLTIEPTGFLIRRLNLLLIFLKIKSTLSRSRLMRSVIF